MAEQQILSLLVPTGLRDDIIDALIGCELVSGFSMTAIAGYSREHSQYDVREQVAGYRELFRFDVMHERECQDALMHELHATFETTSIRYWITPVLEQGHL